MQYQPKCRRKFGRDTPLKNIPHEDIRKETADNRKKLEEEGFCVVEMREFEWLKTRKQPEVSRFLKTLKSITPKRKLTFEKIVKGIRNESLYGFLIVDIHTPNELKEKFKDFLLRTVLFLEKTLVTICKTWQRSITF